MKILKLFNWWIIVPIVLGLALSHFVHADTTVVVGQTVASGGDYSDITFWWRCEGATLGADDYYGSGDNTATASSLADITTDAMFVGTNGAEFPTSGDYWNFDVSSNDIVSGTSGTAAFWWRYDTTASFANYEILFNLLNGTTRQLEVSTYSDDTIRVRWDNGTYSWVDTTPAVVIAVGTDYFIQIAWDSATNYMSITMNDTEILSSTATTFSALTIDSFRIGGTIDSHIDNLMISDDYTRDFYPLRNETTSPR